MHEPPVVRFCGHLKYMRFSDFDDVQRMLLDFCFPGFRGAHKPNSAPAELSSNELGLDGLTIMPGNWRRYAPSILFPRSRYFSVVRDPDREDDGGTLA